MQLQIECNHTPFQKQLCLTCNSLFEMTEAKVIVCNAQGEAYGEVCPHCLKKGFNWLSDRVDQLNQSKTVDINQPSRNWKIPIGA